MPKNKDLKNVVRQRMAKTGESYSIARMRMAKPVSIGTARSFDEEGLGLIFQLRISLEDVAPAIWRHLHVPADLTLADVSLVFIEAMGWTNSHLHETIANGLRYAKPESESERGAIGLPDTIDEATVTLRQLVESGATKFRFVYDSGDYWAHNVEVESTSVEPVPGVSYPSCIAGQRACPPEDCGGTAGYMGLVEALADPKHEDHRSIRAWVGRSYNPEDFGVALVNVALEKQGKKRAMRKPQSAVRA